LRGGEKFLVITDTAKKSIGEALFLAGAEKTESILALITGDPPEPLALMWKKVDAFLAVTEKSLTHTKARIEATKAGVRGATLPRITEEIFLETLNIDYSTVEEYVSKMANAMKGKNVRITSESGTDLMLSIEGRRLFLDTGILRERGAFGNLPAGEVCVAPVEGMASGVLVFDGSMAGIGRLSESIRMEVEHGYVTEISGGAEAEELQRLLENKGREAYNIAELGIGCNPAARVMGNVLVDEKIYRTVHIALGDNTAFGGKIRTDVHMDGVILNPTLVVDGKTIIERGEWTI
jgi:leucyl aminopeptidase (aminopeptidase T)